MDGGGSMQSNEERGAEKLMDDHLKSIGLHRKKVAKDGSCLFRAVAEQVLHCQSLHTEVRAQCVEFLKQNRDTYEAFIEGDFEDYLFKLQDPQQWVGEVEINALAVMYKRDFLIFQEPGKPAVNITDNNFKDKVRLCFLNGNHYDSVYPISRIKSAALCQSILYELLYDGVFKVDRGVLSQCQRSGRYSDNVSDDNMAVCCSSDESDLDGGEALWVENGTSTTSTRHNRGRGRGRHLPESVRRSLNPTLLRNVQYDVWHKTKRAQQKMDYCIAAGMQFTVGDRCQVRLEGGGRSYNATIKEVPPNNGLVTVYIEEMGRKQVPLWSVRPPNAESSWSTVVNRDKRLSNGHGEWEERGGRGRGRGKHIPASSSVSQATTPGSSGRVQKQHSWTSQATVEEQGGVKANRKLESMFGLTEEERLAKEEEERNVALVEIQLRDEHSFPALGTQPVPQADGGKKKGGEKRRSQRNKAKSPVEDVRASSPPKSSTPPPPAAAAVSTNTTMPGSPAPPAAKPPAAPPADGDSAPTWLGSVKAALPNMAAASSAASAALAPSAPLTCAAPAAKTSAPSHAVAAASPSADRSAPGGAVPPSVPSSASLISLKPPLLPAATSPPTSHTLSSSSKLHPSSASPPPSSSLPSPTFIAPIAPSPAAAQGFLPPSSLPRSSPPIPSLRHSPSPPSFSSSPPLVDRAAPVQEAPAQAPSSVSDPGGAVQTSSVHPQVSLPPSQNQVSVVPVSQTQTPASCQTHPSLPPDQVLMPPTEAQVRVLQHQPQTLPQAQISLPAPGASHLPPSVTHPHPHIPPSQPPPPSLPVSTSPAHPSLQSQNQTETPPPPAQPQSQPDSSPAHPPPPHPSHPPPPLNPPSIPGAFPLQQLSQLYQDPLYPGFPQGDKGDVAPTPPFSSSKTGDDLPRDVGVLRFFFNLGVKAYSMPMFPPYIYLLPLQQAHTMHPKLPSRSPSPTPHYPPANPPIRHQEAYPHPQYPPSSASMPPQFDHQAPVTEPPRPTDTSFNQAGYPVTQPPPQRMACPSPSWQQHQMPPPRNPSFPGGYPTPSPPYPVSAALSQGFHPGQGPGHPLYPATVPPYPPTSLGYQPSSAHEELQVNQEAMEQHHPVNGDTMAGQGPGRVPAPAAANVANANNNRTVVLPGFAHKQEALESLSRTVLLVDPPLNNNPILVSNPGVKDVPVSMTTMKHSSTPLSHDLISKATIHGDSKPLRSYHSHHKPVHPITTYVPLGVPDPGPAGYLATAEPLSVGCSTEDDWEEQLGFKPTTPNHRGMRRNLRGAGGGGGRGRAPYRRRHGEAGAGYGYVQYNSSHRGRGRQTGF